MVVNKCLVVVARSREHHSLTVLDTCQSVLLRTYPQAAVRCGSHGRYLVACQFTVVAYDSPVARTVPDLSVCCLRNSGNIAQEVRLELIDIVPIVCQSRLLRTDPQQVGVIDIDTLNAHHVHLTMFSNGVTRLNLLHLEGVDVDPDEPRTVSSNPDVSLAVARHSVNDAVGTDAGHPQQVADGRIP